jgi:hypothetical protein
VAQVVIDIARSNEGRIAFMHEGSGLGSLEARDGGGGKRAPIAPVRGGDVEQQYRHFCIRYVRGNS